MRRSFRFGLGVLATAAVLGGATSSGAAAQIVGGDGVWGVTYVGGVNCNYLNNSSSVKVSVGTPAVYAKNLTAGAGNDWQIVRYRVIFVDTYQIANIVHITDWSGAVWAGDSQPARWSGATPFTYRFKSRIMAFTQVAFYNRAGQFEGWTTWSHERYQNYEESSISGYSDGNCLTYRENLFA